MTATPLLRWRFLASALLGLATGILPLPGQTAPGDTQLVTATLAGLPSDQSWDTRYSVSADGRYVAFESFDSKLVPNDTNGRTDVFVRDVLAGTTELISVGAGNEQANHDSRNASISADGRYVAFASVAGNLIVPGGRPVQYNIFVRDRVLGTGEVAEFEAARLLGVQLLEARHEGYDAVRNSNGTLQRLQIKGRCQLPGCRRGQGIGRIDIAKEFDGVLWS